MSDSFATPWMVACEAPLSMKFPKQEYWSRLPFAPSGDLPNPGIKPASPTWQADSLPLSHQGKPPNYLYGNPLQYSCLENPIDRGAWGAIPHGVAE